MAGRTDFYAAGACNTYIAQDDQVFSITEIAWQMNDAPPTFFGHVETEDDYPGLRAGPAAIGSRHGAAFSRIATIEITHAAGCYAHFTGGTE